jgi:hypothetical protein
MDMNAIQQWLLEKCVVRHSLLVFLDGVEVIAKNIFSCLKISEIKI